MILFERGQWLITAENLLYLYLLMYVVEPPEFFQGGQVTHGGSFEGVSWLCLPVLVEIGVTGETVFGGGSRYLLIDICRYIY